MNCQTVTYTHPFFNLKIKVEDSKIVIFDTKNNSRLVDSFYIETEKMKTEKLNTARFLAECVFSRRLKKSEAIVFKDGDETNFNLFNLQIVTLPQVSYTIYIAINLDQNDKRTEYKSLQSISRALGNSGSVIRAFFNGEVERVKSPRTQNWYLFEKRTVKL